ncbi:hypothetical protein RB653_008701 [Dictyostelium firmibasis]|uniref:Uncharacterized protein n=1 Tax=Dictyostelium firmibasis TaxID=79012 RepID=A0AAN7U0I7_9MYCE
MQEIKKIYIIFLFLNLLISSTFGFIDCGILKCEGVERQVCENMGGRFFPYDPSVGACCSFCLSKEGLQLNAYTLEWIAKTTFEQ